MSTVKSTFVQIIKRKETLLFLILFISGLSLLGWMMDKIILTSVSLKYIPIAPSTALIFVVLSILTLITNKFENQYISKSVGILILLLVVLFCVDIILNYFFNFKWDIENILIKIPSTLGNVPIGRMSPITALLFIFICICLLSDRQNIPNTIKYIGGSFSLMTCILSSVLLIGYLYKAPLLYGSNIIPVALPTAICFLLFSITLLRIFEFKFWTFSLIKENPITLQLLRLFLPLVVIAVIVQGLLITNFSIKGSNPTLSITFILFILIVVIIYIVVKTSEKLGYKLSEAEEKLKANETILIQLNADKDLFISILGHDLRSPFNNLLGTSEVLIEDLHKLNIDEIENHINNINKTARNTFNLLEDLLNWGKVQQGRIQFIPQNLSFAEICTNIIEVLETTANAKNIKINYSETNHLNVFADSDMLKTVLRNLVSNAIKFTYSGGAINIYAEQTDTNVTISVSDNGIGISLDNLVKLFDISQILTTKGTAKETGTGLGLLLCKGFVEKQGGKIWVESEEGKGSTFYFTIPNNDETNGINAVENVVSYDEINNQIEKLKILITDDDDASRMFLGISVKMFAKEILYAQNGFEAVVACKDNPDIDLVLMDIKMPKMDGFEATRQIRQFNKEAIIIIQTAYANSSENDKAKEAGCNDFISKPIIQTLLKELIKKHCKN